MNRFSLWIAQGFGVGRIPVAPGTFGSVLGVVWFLVLLLPRNLPVFIAGTIAGVAVSVWFCGVGEKVLRQKDPGSIVLDEIAAMPVCFAFWTGAMYARDGSLPPPEFFVSAPGLPWTAGVFVAFRLFDVVKPWPVRQSQSLSGGWGVTMDDVLAAVYVNMLFAVVYLWIG